MNSSPDQEDLGYQWFVAKTKPQRERQVAATLTARGVEVYLPLARTLRQRRLAPLFPGYLFTQLDLRGNDFIQVRSAPGVSYVLGSQGQPSPVPDDVVEHVRQRLDALGGVLRPVFRQGERVYIQGGPLAGLEAVFDCSLSSAGRSRVFLAVFGRLTALSISDEYLSKVG